MASEAEVELIVSTGDTLVDLERELEAIVRAAEASADAIELEALLDADQSLAGLISDLNDVVGLAEAAGDTIAVDAALDSLSSLDDLQDDLNDLIHEAEIAADEIQLDVELDADLAQLDAELAALVEELEESADDVDIDVNVDRDGSAGRGIRRLGSLFAGLGRVTGVLAGGMSALSLGVGTLPPLLASVASGLQALGPAAAVGVSGILALQLATNTVRIAMIGVGEAVQTAFDPEAKPEELAKALKGLAPSAREFVLELRSMKDEFKEIQQDVQENFFAGLADSLANLSVTVLPVLGNALRATSTTLNEMARRAADAASELGSNGTLGRALSSANIGLFNLRKAPAAVVTALGQLAAAAGPSFERITAAAAKAGGEIADKLAKAFESGGLESAIEGAVDTLAQLKRIADNVFEGLGNIIETTSGQTEGLFSVLEKVTRAFADVTATQGFQQALGALVQTAGVLVDTLLPLIGQALQALGPVFLALAAPVQILVRALGDALSKVIAALGPVLKSLALAFGQLVIAVTPLINLAGTLIAAILPVLTPLFDALGQALNTVTPFVEQLASLLAAQLVPIFTALATEVLPQILPPFIELATRIFPVLTDILVKLAPSVTKLAETLADLLVELAPVIAQILTLSVMIAEELAPVLQPLIDLIISLIDSAFGVLVAQISGLLIPVLRILVDFLKGDFNAAWRGVEELVRNVRDKVTQYLQRMVEDGIAALTTFALRVGEKALEAARQLENRIREGVDDAVRDIQSLPRRAAESLANAGTALASAGRDLVQGFINGITSKLGELRAAAQEIADSVAGSVAGFLGIQSPSRVMMEIGDDVMKGLSIGIADGIPDLRRELQGVAALVPSFALPNGQRLPLPQFQQQGAPTVQVFIGNEQLDSRVDSRIARSDQARDRLITQGVRR